MSEEQARELLAAVRKASKEARCAQVAMLEAADIRSQAVRDALDAGIPRDQIAKAAGVRRTAIYKIAAN